MFYFNNKSGQSLIEGLVVVMIATILMFATIQVCIIATDDMFANYVAFNTTRKVVLSQTKDISNVSKQSVSKFFTAYMLNSKSFINYKTTYWNEDILGNKLKDHSNNNINKYSVKIGYYTKIMFYKLFNSNPFRQQSARARMVKSPDQKFYNKAYPNAKEFPKYNQ